MSSGQVKNGISSGINGQGIPTAIPNKTDSRTLQSQKDLSPKFAANGSSEEIQSEINDLRLINVELKVHN